MSNTLCEGCGQHSFLLPLHGGKGGPLRCPLCVGKWNAEHGRKRRTGRIVIRAIKAFLGALSSIVEIAGKVARDSVVPLKRGGMSCGRRRTEPLPAPKPSAFRIAAAGSRWATARAIGALLDAGQHPGRAMLELLRWELEQDPIRPVLAAKWWRNRVLADIASEDRAARTGPLSCSPAVRRPAPRTPAPNVSQARHIQPNQKGGRR